jgi:ribosome-associated heat shock protein Hsp15
MRFFIFETMAEKEKLRLDKYLWAIRLFKTRSSARAACNKGKVKFNDDPTKASRHIIEGDEYEVKTETKRWRIKVTGLLHKRLAYTESINYYLDITPAEEIERINLLAAGFHTRKSKTGRPTKKDRRDLNEFLDD